MTTSRLVPVVLCLLANSLSFNTALVSAPSRPTTTANQSPAFETGKDNYNSIDDRRKNQATKSPITAATADKKITIARIRSTRRTDIDAVADLLSSAISGDLTSCASNRKNDNTFRMRVERLRTKSSLRTTLDLRMRAMEEGKKQLAQQTTTQANQHNDDDDRAQQQVLQHLWSTKHSFRRKIKQAAEVSNEPHPWQHHNFDVVPPNDSCWLRHEMISAQDITTGNIIGFCEIAMLHCPPSTVTKAATEMGPPDVAPTIANLIVSPTWRRKGVARGLIKSAERIVQRKWKCDRLGLYVERNNGKAMDLYMRSGYEVTTWSSLHAADASSTRWYMNKSLC